MGWVRMGETLSKESGQGYVGDLKPPGHLEVKEEGLCSVQGLAAWLCDWSTPWLCLGLG